MSLDFDLTTFFQKVIVLHFSNLRVNVSVRLKSFQFHMCVSWGLNLTDDGGKMNITPKNIVSFVLSICLCLCLCEMNITPETLCLWGPAAGWQAGATEQENELSGGK